MREVSSKGGGERERERASTTCNYPSGIHRIPSLPPKPRSPSPAGQPWGDTRFTTRRSRPRGFTLCAALQVLQVLVPKPAPPWLLPVALLRSPSGLCCPAEMQGAR